MEGITPSTAPAAPAAPVAPASRKMGRPAIYSPEERLARMRASRARWRDRNKDAVRAKEAVKRATPAYRERDRQRRKALYGAKRQALLDTGWRPRPVGRPRLRTPEEAAEIHRRGNRAYMMRRRARERAQKALLEVESAAAPEPVRSPDETFFPSEYQNPSCPRHHDEATSRRGPPGG